MKKMTTVTRTGSRLEKLKNLALVLANNLDNPDIDEKTIPTLAKQYRETIAEIDEIKGALDQDDEVGEILRERAADGKPGAIRKSRTGIQSV